MELGNLGKTETIYVYKIYSSPVGKLKLIASKKGLAAVLWENDDPKRVRLAPVIFDERNSLLRNTELQLTEYFLGKRTVFSIELDFRGTEFQKRVWLALLEIPYGETRSYGQIAELLKRPRACRAVGAANGKNPISIIAACHRVIGASGKLTGFAGGLETKSFLLNHEAKYC